VAPSSPIGRRYTVGLLLTLTAVTGLVDAVSYLRLGRVFVANMTGNVVFLGFSVAPRSGLSPAASSIAVGGFVIGALVGGRIATLLARDPRRWLVVAFGIEAVIVAGVALLSGLGIAAYLGDGRYATIAVLAAALGIQNSTVRRLSAPDLTTTVLTLTLTGLAADSFLAGGPGAKPHRRIGSVATMLGGAAAGAGLLQVSATAVIAIAAGAVGAVALGFALAPPSAPDPELDTSV
jgi:uncharacterized membrane protein YoaK (UPF0700 family)